MEQTSLSDAKAHLSAYAADVVRTHNRISITRNGRRELVLMSADDLDALEETLDVLRDERLVQELSEARREVADGQVTFERPAWSGPSADVP
jgi:prevent-host-death family protein